MVFTSRPLAYATVTLAALAASMSSATIYFQEDFTSGLGKWVASNVSQNYGKVAVSAGSFYGDATINKGLQTQTDASFYALSAPFTTPFNNSAAPLVLSLSSKYDQGRTCGGGYVKLAYDSFVPINATSQSPFWVVFGADQCGWERTLKLSFLRNYTTYAWKKSIPLNAVTDRLTHVYTLSVQTDNTYAVYVDQTEVASGNLEDDWNWNGVARYIDNPASPIPSSWNTQPYVSDSSDTQPADWNSAPQQIESTQPAGYDAAVSGPFVPTLIANPAYQGTFLPKLIPNPQYSGTYLPDQIQNPLFVADPTLHAAEGLLNYVFIDVWQVKAGTIFDNIIVADDLTAVNNFISSTWGATKTAEANAAAAAGY